VGRRKQGKTKRSDEEEEEVMVLEREADVSVKA